MPGRPRQFRPKKQRKYAKDAHSPTTSQRGYGTAWQKARRMVLADSPLCIQCLARGRCVPAEEVDHIVPLKAGGTNDRSNLQALCKACHSAKTMRENPQCRGGMGVK